MQNSFIGGDIFTFLSNGAAVGGSGLNYGSFYDTDSALSPTRLWVAYECGITPVTGGNQWYSQGPGANSYQVDNGGFIINTVFC
jgi:hypothetical protein